MSATEQAVEQVANVAESVGEEALEFAEAARQVGVSQTTLVIGIGVGIAVGAGVGYYVAKRRLTTKFDKIAQDEIEQMRSHYRAKEAARQEQTEKPDLQDKVKELGYVPPREEKSPAVAPVPEPEAKNVFEEHGEEGGERGLSTDVWDHDKELASRVVGQPFVIHREEFGDGDREKTTLTYYVQDDVLANEADQRMEGIDETVGLENLEKFGHGSDDANVVYVRNDRLDVDFEIVRSGGSFTAEVLGQDDGLDDERQLEHSATRRRRSPRGDGDG